MDFFIFQYQCIFVDAFMTYFVAYFLYVLIECPFYNIISICKNPNQFTDENSNQINSSELKKLNHRSKDNIDVEVKYSFTGE